MEQLTLAEILSESLAEAKNEAKHEAEARRRRYHGRSATTHEGDLDDGTAQMGLVFEVRRKRGRPKGSKKEPNRNQETWTDDAVYLVMDGLLHSVSKAFDGDTSESERDTILSWVAAPLHEPCDLPNPYSFEACCVTFGYDAELLQRAILYQAERLSQSESKDVATNDRAKTA